MRKARKKTANVCKHFVAGKRERKREIKSFDVGWQSMSIKNACGKEIPRDFQLTVAQNCHRIIFLRLAVAMMQSQVMQGTPQDGLGIEQ